MKYRNMICFAALMFGMILCFSCGVGAVECTSQFPDEYSEYINAETLHDTIVRWQHEPFTPSAIEEAESYEIIHITEMYENWYTDEVKYLLVDIAWNTGANKTFILSAEDGHVKTSFNSSSYYLRHLGIEGIKNPANRLMYEGGFDYYVIKTDPDTDEMYVEDCRTGEKYYDLEQYEKPVMIETDGDDLYGSMQSTEIEMTEKQIRKMRERQQEEQYSVQAIDPVYGYIDDVPMNIQDNENFPCIPTTILNIMQYWDENGYSDLISGISTAKTNIIDALNLQTDNPETPEIEIGYKKNSSIPGAISHYAAIKGYEGRAVNMPNPDFFDLKYEIHYGYPCMVGFPVGVFHPRSGHMTTGVGYFVEDDIEYVYVYDNSSDDPAIEPVTMEFSRCDFISGIEILDLN